MPSAPARATLLPGRISRWPSARLKTAIAQARGLRASGRKHFRLRFPFNLKIREGAGAFVCGEETALIASIEGRVGEPRPRPPFPAQRASGASPPTSTMSRPGRTSPPSSPGGPTGTPPSAPERAQGTTIFSLVGKINNTGLVEVPLGITLREIIYDIGGGISGQPAIQGRADRRPLRRLHPGGASGHAGGL